MQSAPKPSYNLWLKASALVAEILLIQSTPEPYGHPPPSYDDAIIDLPPEYGTPDILAEAQVLVPETAPEKCDRASKEKQASILPDPTTGTLINLDDNSNFRMHPKKKKGAAAKKATSNKWAGSGDEGEKKDDPPPPEVGGGGDASGGAGGGDGGDGGGGGDDGAGDDPDDWFGTSTKKKKKKGKKAEEEEKAKEEEERKAKEEEEQKAKEEEEAKAAAAAADAGNSLSWADEVAEANPDDSWAGFATAGKKKKKKKVNISF